LIEADFESLQAEIDSLRISENDNNQSHITELIEHIKALNEVDWFRACKLAEQTLSISRELEFDIGIASSLSAIGISHSYSGEYEKAKHYFLKALKIAEDTNSIDHEMCALECLSTLNETMGDFHEALEYYTKYSELKQRVFSEDSIKNINQLRVSYETEKKEKDNEIFRLRNIELVKTHEELEKALSEVDELSRLLPICSSCKKIRRDSGYWVQIEKYISRRSNAQFSHGLCPECVKKLYPELSDSDA